MPSLATLHSKAVAKAKSLHRIVSKQEGFVDEVTRRGVATLITVAAGAGGALVDYYAGTSTDAIPQANIQGIPINLTAAAAAKVAAFLFTGREASPYIHDAANGLGAYAVGTEVLRLLKNQSVTSSAPAST